MNLSCQRISELYRFGMIILFFLALFFSPMFGFPASFPIALAVGLFHTAIYSFDDNEERIYYKQYCFYLVLIQYLIIAISLYQIILGDPTNWLGTGIDLTKLPKV